MIATVVLSFPRGGKTESQRRGMTPMNFSQHPLRRTIAQLQADFLYSATDEPSAQTFVIVGTVTEIERRCTVMMLEISDDSASIEAWVPRQDGLDNYIRLGSLVAITGRVFSMNRGMDLLFLVEGFTTMGI